MKRFYVLLVMGLGLCSGMLAPAQAGGTRTGNMWGSTVSVTLPTNWVFVDKPPPGGDPGTILTFCPGYLVDLAHSYVMVHSYREIPSAREEAERFRQHVLKDTDKVTDVRDLREGGVSAATFSYIAGNAGGIRQEVWIYFVPHRKNLVVLMFWLPKDQLSNYRSDVDYILKNSEIY